MHHIRILAVAATHQVYRGLLAASGRTEGTEQCTDERTRTASDRRDRGAVSLEQVLWFVAAGVSVAVIASILWSQIRDEAERPVQTPASP